MKSVVTRQKLPLEMPGRGGLCVRQWGEQRAEAGHSDRPTPFLQPRKELERERFGRAEPAVLWSVPLHAHIVHTSGVSRGQEVAVGEDNHRVQVFGLDGTFVQQWGGEGLGSSWRHMMWL